MSTDVNSCLYIVYVVWLYSLALFPSLSSFIFIFIFIFIFYIYVYGCFQ